MRPPPPAAADPVPLHCLHQAGDPASVLPAHLVKRARSIKRARWDPGWADAGMVVAYLGRFRSTERVCVVQDRGGGAGETACFECAGTGTFEEPEALVPCRSCKGSGRVLLSI